MKNPANKCTQPDKEMNLKIAVHMFRTYYLPGLILLFIFSAAVLTGVSVTTGQESAKKITEEDVFSALNRLDGRPLEPERDPDIDLYMNGWQHSIPYNTHGSIIERAILTINDGDSLKPSRKGAVLKYINRFSRASLDSYASTTPTTLDGEQEIFIITSGKGIIKAGGKTAELRDGILVLMPEGLEFTMTNTGDTPLIMYLINEPVPDGFKPVKDMLVKDEKSMPYRDKGILKTHWNHNGKNIFNGRNGLATIQAITLITADPMTIGHPHSHGEGLEEFWTVIEGKSLAFIGKEIRWQHPGEAYYIPPTGYTPHANINMTEERVKFLYVSKLGD